MSDTDWFWVRSSSTRVDTAQVSLAAVKTNLSEELVRKAMVSVALVDAFPSRSPLEYAPFDPVIVSLIEQKEALDVQFQGLREEILESLRGIAADVSNHFEWLSLAALIYSSAEMNSQAFFDHCSVVETLPCPPSQGGPLFGLVGSIPGYVRSMGAGPSGGQGARSKPSISGIQAENQLRDLAVSLSGEGATTAVLASKLARIWSGVSPLVWAGSSGVVVSGNGKSAWVHPGRSRKTWHTVELPGTSANDTHLEHKGESEQSSGGIFWPSVWSSETHPVRLAHLQMTEELRSSPYCIPGAKPPGTASELLARLHDSPNLSGTGEIQILKHSGTSLGGNSWTVVIRGTQEWLPGTTNPQDMLSNLHEVAGELSDQHMAVSGAMNLAGIGAGDPVELVGHSQGGAVALSLAASDQINSRYRIVSVLTAGAPAGASPDSSLNVLALENTSDVVPALDGKPASATGNHVVVHFEHSSLDTSADHGAHSVHTYREAARLLHIESGTNTDLKDLRDWEQHRVATLGLNTDSVTTESMFFTTQRTGGHVEQPRGWIAGSAVAKPIA